MRLPRPIHALGSRGLGAFREARIRWQQPRSAPIVTTWTRPAGAPSNRGAPEFDGARAYELLREQCALGPRAPGGAAHARMPAWLEEQLRPWCDEVAVQRWHQRVARGPGAPHTFALTNVFARIGGDGPGAVMLSAHWDTRPVAERDPDPALRALPIDGANDGASGVAVLLELARALRAAPAPHPVILAFWDGEDFGEYYYGSRIFARHAAGEPRWRAERGVVLDMVGKEGLRCVTEAHSVVAAPRVWHSLHESARELGVEGSFGGPTLAVRDDHIFLNRAGIPTVLLIDYLYPQWHTRADTVERCSPQSLATVGSVVLHWVRRAP